MLNGYLVGSTFSVSLSIRQRYGSPVVLSAGGRCRRDFIAQLYSCDVDQVMCRSMACDGTTARDQGCSQGFWRKTGVHIYPGLFPRSKRGKYAFPAVR